MQQGFRRKRVTEITNEIYSYTDNNQINLLTLCDLPKVFDSVNFEILLNTIRNEETDSDCFIIYISARTQSVTSLENISSKQQVSFSIPQGFILGPLLFILFINDLSIKKNKSNSFNSTETTFYIFFIIISSRHNRAKVAKDIIIEFEGCHKTSISARSLGIYIDKYMAFETHITTFTGK